MLFRKRPQQSTEPAPGQAAPDEDVRQVHLPPSPGVANQARMMKRQLTSSDARTDRLVRQLRDEIEGVRSILDEFAEDQEALLAADVDAIAEDPEAAAALPAPLLVRTILAVNQERADALARSDLLAQEVKDLEREVQELRLSEAGLQGRLETFDDVIAALHSNLEDLRFARDQAALAVELQRPRLKAIHDSEGEESGAAGGRA